MQNPDEAGASQLSIVATALASFPALAWRPRGLIRFLVRDPAVVALGELKRKSKICENSTERVDFETDRSEHS